MTAQEFEFLKEYGKRLSEINGKHIDVTQLPYIFVKSEFLHMVQNGKIIESVKEVLNKLDIPFKKLSVKQINSIFLHLFDEMLTSDGVINRNERNFLSSSPNPKMIAAGVKSLDPFNVHLTLLSLAKEMNMKVKEIEVLPYYELLDYQVALFRQSKVRENYNEIILKKK